MSFVVGYLLATLGLGLLLLGDVPLGKGKILPAARARVAGAALMAYLPLALLVSLLPDLGLPYLHASLMGVAMVVAVGVAAVFVYPYAFPPRPKSLRKASGATEAMTAPPREDDAPMLLTPSDEAPMAWLEPNPQMPPSPPAKGRKPAQDHNPFDFS